jgi:hypothetical protein
MTVKGPIPSVIVLTFSFVALLAADEGKHNCKPGTGYVPDAATAIKIAIAVWKPIYGGGTHCWRTAVSCRAEKRDFDC